MTRIFQIVSCLLIVSVLAWAQGTTAQINGNVKDSSGLAVPGAEVKVTQTATGATRTATSGPDGAYVLPNLPIGPYMLEIGKEGFSKYVQSGIVLQVNSNPTIEAALKVGAVTEQVNVQADAAMVETHSTGVGQVVDSQRVSELPLNGRNVTELIFLAGISTVVASGASSGLSSTRNYPTVVISVSGGIANWTTFLLDGTGHNDPYTNQGYPLPFPDALQEFKVETSALPAQYGQHASAAVNAVTKSGTNAFHGDIFEFLRNGDLNARDYFAPRRDSLKRSQFGGTAGGRIIRDKLFFFAGYQGTEQRSTPAQQVAYVPTPAELAGDFTTVAGPGCNNGKTVTLAASQGFAGNKIAPSLLNASSLKLDQIGLPATTNPCGQIQYGLISNQTEHMGVARIDYQKSDKHSIFGRFFVTNLNSPQSFNNGNLITILNPPTNDRVYSLGIGDTYLIGANMVSSFHVGATRSTIGTIPPHYITYSDIGVNATSFGAPIIGVTVGGNGFAFGGGSAIKTYNNMGPNENVAEDLSWIRGSHQIQFGGTYMYQMANTLATQNSVGLSTFDGSVTGLGMADFLIGIDQTWLQGNNALYYNRAKYFSLYVQDTWKATSRLTVSYGLRWEPYLSPYSKFGWTTNVNPVAFAQNIHTSIYTNSPVGVFYSGDPQYTAGNGFSNNRFNEFLPRLGVVWDPKGDGKMTIRAAFGMFTDKPQFNAGSGEALSGPFATSISLNNVSFSNPWGGYPGGNPLPSVLSKNIAFPPYEGYSTYPPGLDYKPISVNEWNLSVQRQIGQDWLLTANYIGNNTFHLTSPVDINPAVYLGLGQCTIAGISYPVCSTTKNTNQRRLLYLQNPAQGQAFSYVNEQGDGGTGSYNALFLSAQKRLSRGVSVLANYTYSHCIADLWVYSAKTPVETPNNRRNDRGNCGGGGGGGGLDQRQVFNLSAVAQTPKFSNKMLRLLASSWQISPIMSIKSAQLFTVTSGVDAALNGDGSQRPNIVPGVNPYVSSRTCPTATTCLSWLTPTAFSLPAAGTIGNLGVENLKGPSIFQLDVALSRTFPILEKRTLQLRADFFNLPNHMNPSTPTAATNSGAFGTITSDISGTQGLSAGDPRIIQVAMKFVF